MLHYSYCVLIRNTFAHHVLKAKAVDQYLAWLFAANLANPQFLTWGILTFISILEITVLSFQSKQWMQAGCLNFRVPEEPTQLPLVVFTLHIAADTKM